MSSKKEQLKYIRFKKGGIISNKKPVLKTLVTKAKAKKKVSESSKKEQLKNVTVIPKKTPTIKIPSFETIIPSKKEQLKNVTVIPRKMPATSMPAWVIPAAAVGAGLYLLRK